MIVLQHRFAYPTHAAASYRVACASSSVCMYRVLEAIGIFSERSRRRRRGPVGRRGEYRDERLTTFAESNSRRDSQTLRTTTEM